MKMGLRKTANLIILGIFILSIAVSFPLKNIIKKDMDECSKIAGIKQSIDDRIKMRMATKDSQDNCCYFKIIKNKIDENCG